MNYSTVKEVSRLELKGNFQAKELVQWSKIDYECDEKVEPLMSHSAVDYRGKIYMFGGCQMYNRKR
jgi:hypothetical protein